MCRVGVLPVDEAYFDAFWARIPDEYQARIGDGIRCGAVVVQGYRFRPVGLARGKGPYQLVGQDTAARRPSPHWEYFIQLAEFLRLMKLPMPPGHTLGFEDGLMDITVRRNGELLWCLEVKETAEKLAALRTGLLSYALAVPVEQRDRGNDPLRKAKYLVRHRPRYLSLVAIGMREHYDVNYLGPVTFALSPLAAEPDLRASGD